MKLIRVYLRPLYKRMAGGLLIKIIGTVCDLFLPWLLAFTIDSIIPLQQIRPIFLCGLLMLLSAAVAVSGNILANRLASAVARDFTQKLRHDLLAKLLCLSARQVDDLGASSLESRLTSDTYNLHELIGRMQRLGVRAPILLVGGIIITLTLDPQLTLVMVSVLPIITCVVILISRHSIPQFRELQRSVDNLVRVIRENISGARIIKALSKTTYEQNRFDQANRETVNQETRASATMAVTSPIMDFSLNIGLTLVILIGAFRVNRGATQPGVIIAFLSYFTIILNAMISVTRMFVMFTRGSASAERIAQVLNCPADLQTLPLSAGGARSAETPPLICFNQVDFAYPGQKALLEQLSFSLEEGQTLGIIGPTGSGKSTLIKLLLRLYDVSHGQILLDGQDLRSLDRSALRQNFGVVFQNDFIMSDTIKANLLFARTIPDEQLQQAAQIAQAGDFIDTLPNKANYQLAANGSNLSGGQRQRILLARALAGQPRILVLDDATSALDYETDARFRQALGRQTKPQSKIIVAQRVSSLLQADQIMVMEEGRIVGLGSHEMLLKTCPSYRQICQIQLGDDNIA
ncbi:MAG: ABC transporter ATP-binding protein [Oscillospiraceae bacterium]|nr:ABC transporter ATP-binding protein [Oscillospiraceae bacterium]